MQIERHATLSPPAMERNLHYSLWILCEQKGMSIFLLLVATALSAGLWHSTASPLLGITVFGVFLLTFWQTFVPMSFEINSDGIVHGTFGRKRFIAWEDIQSYRVQPTGILMFPHTNHYLLESFRGFFLPVPKELREDVQYRFTFFVDQTVDP